MPPLPPAKPAKPRFRIPARWQEISLDIDDGRDFDLPRALLRIDTPGSRKKPYGFWGTIGRSILIIAAAFYIGNILVEIEELLLADSGYGPIEVIVDQGIGLHRAITGIMFGVLGFCLTLYAIQSTGLSAQEYFETKSVALKRYLKRCIPIVLYLVFMLILTFFLDETFTNPYFKQLYATCTIPSVLAILLVIVAPVFE